MKKVLFIPTLYVLLFTISQTLSAQKLTTLAPAVDRQSQRYVSITKVVLTEQYTIIYFRYKQASNPFDQLLGRDNKQLIQIDPESYLYQPRNQNKKFKFVKAVGIPVSPKQLNVPAGEEINFSVYYDKLEPGIENFDLFEGEDNPKNNLQFWNFYGIKIRNPKAQKKIIPNDVKTEIKKNAPVAIEAPKPTVEDKPLVTTPEVASPSFFTIRGTILDAKTKQSIPSSKLNYSVPNDDNGVDSLQLSASAGKFKLVLSPNQKYGYVASAKGYFPSSGEFDLSKPASAQEIVAEILLSPVAVGEAVTLNNIYFQVTKFDLLPNSYPQLDQLVKLLKENPQAEIRVEGHTDNVGDFDENIKLSLERANSVKKYLVSKGIESSRVEPKGYGPTRPISKGSTDEERQKNRRVEFVILKM